LASISEKIKPFHDQEYDITPYWDLNESISIANRIAAALNLGGWKYIKPERSSFLLGGVAGVQVWLHPSADESVKRAADALISALNEEDISATLKEQNPANPKDNKIHLSVGTKP
jgi:hypothetical protein